MNDLFFNRLTVYRISFKHLYSQGIAVCIGNQTHANLHFALFAVAIVPESRQFVFNAFNKVYCSKVFTYTPDVMTHIQSSVVIKGGTGYNFTNTLFCDDFLPDYSLYPMYREAYGFLTRGCIRHCPWCIVPHKEGSIRPYSDIETVLQGRKRAILLDNNVLASSFGLEQIEKIVQLKCRVDFTQGLDARLVTDDVAKLLSKVKWIEVIRFALDTELQIKPLLSALEKLNRYAPRPKKRLILPVSRKC